MKWYEILPKDALDIDCRERPDLDPPLNEMEEVCPWPWEPQQLVAAAIGQFHCSYCGAMCVAGMRHPDYTGFMDEYHAFLDAELERNYRLHMHHTLYGNLPPAQVSEIDPIFGEAPW